MMVPLTVVAATFLIHLSWGYNEELFPLSDNLESSYLYPEEFPDDNDFEIHRRNSNNFLRFGRGGGDLDYDDYKQDFTRPTRSGKIEKNDHFIRFGRQSPHLRYGRDPSRSSYLRFGRSVQDVEEKKRNKRDTYSEFKKNRSNYLRFGRNSNFLRFGRNNDMLGTADKTQQSPLIQLLTELIDHIKKEQNKSDGVV